MAPLKGGGPMVGVVGVAAVVVEGGGLQGRPRQKCRLSLPKRGLISTGRTGNGAVVGVAGVVRAGSGRGVGSSKPMRMKSSVVSNTSTVSGSSMVSTPATGAPVEIPNGTTSRP